MKITAHFFLRSEFMDSRLMKQSKIVTPKPSNALKAWGSFDEKKKFFHEVAFITHFLKGYVGGIVYFKRIASLSTDKNFWFVSLMVDLSYKFPERSTE